MLPLDVHTGAAARKLGLLTRKQSDWQAVEEVTANLRHLDEKDPVKYDFALTRIGIRNDINLKEIMEYNYTGQGTMNSMGGVCNG
jgi:hypothetical protein